MAGRCCCCSSASTRPQAASRNDQGCTLVENGILFPRRRSNLPSIFATDQTYNDHRVFLEEWRRQFELSERNVVRKQANCSSARSDLYQILGLFFVFEGVVLTAVAQANLLRCHNWILPFILCLLTSIAAFLACVQKLMEMSEFKEQLQLERAEFKSLERMIESLKEQGTVLDLLQAQPELRSLYTNPELIGKGTYDKLRSSISQFIRVWMISYAGGVLFLVLLFSGVTLFSIRQILCNPGPS